MDYVDQMNQAKLAAEQWRAKHPIVGVGELRVDLLVDDLVRSISQLRIRVIASEAENDSLRKAAEEYKLRAEKAEEQLRNLEMEKLYDMPSIGGFHDY